MTITAVILIMRTAERGAPYPRTVFFAFAIRPDLGSIKRQSAQMRRRPVDLCFLHDVIPEGRLRLTKVVFGALIRRQQKFAPQFAVIPLVITAPPVAEQAAFLKF